MPRKRYKHQPRNRSVDLRPEKVRRRLKKQGRFKPWNKLASSSKSYWRKKVDIRSVSERRKAPIDRLPGYLRATYKRPAYRNTREDKFVRGAIFNWNKQPPPTDRNPPSFSLLPTTQEREAEQEFSEPPEYGEDIDDLQDYRKDYRDIYGEYPDEFLDDYAFAEGEEDTYLEDEYEEKLVAAYTGGMPKF